MKIGHLSRGNNVSPRREGVSGTDLSEAGAAPHVREATIGIGVPTGREALF